MDSTSSVRTAPPPVAPPPPPIAPPAPAISFKGRVTAKENVKPAATKRDTEQQKQLVVTLSDIQNVQLKTVTTTNNKVGELKIMICHRSFSNPLQHMTKQSPIW